MEVGFTFCLGKTKTATGNDLAGWWIGFLIALTLRMFFITTLICSIIGLKVLG